MKFHLKNNMKNIIGLLLLIFIIDSYNTIKGQESDSIVRYLFAGHTSVTGHADKVDSRLESMDMTEYTGVWLGGDLCIATLVEYETLFYLDDIFDLDNPETHWALGNHDYRNGNLVWYEEFTERPSYYAYSSNSITRVILNTNLVPTQCDHINRQYKIIKDVCDTIENSKHLFLIMHHGLYRNVPGLPIPAIVGHSDLVYWNSNCYDVNSTFVNSIYPMLKEVKERGINVYYLYGDMGSQMKSFDMMSEDSIRFLGCGLYYEDPFDKVMILELNKNNFDLDIQFHNLDSLSNSISK